MFAYATHRTDNRYLRTRCCGVKDAVGRRDVTVRSRRSTFLVHCEHLDGIQDTVKFEILNKRNNSPSGYYFYADPWQSRTGLIEYKPEWVDKDQRCRFNFVIHRWRGPVVAIRTYRHNLLRASNWFSFWETENSNGYVRAYKSPPNAFPSLPKTFILEAGMVTWLIINLESLDRNVK